MPTDNNTIVMDDYYHRLILVGKVKSTVGQSTGILFSINCTTLSSLVHGRRRNIVVLCLNKYSLREELDISEAVTKQFTSEKQKLGAYAWLRWSTATQPLEGLWDIGNSKSYTVTFYVA